ncbi:hypothetical protein WMF30_14165 [Sorangium sp. So ce134]
MSHFRLQLLALSGALVVLPASLASAAITVSITDPPPGATRWYSMPVRAHVTSTLQLASVTAQIDGATTTLRPEGSDMYLGELRVSPRPYGTYTLTVTATDIAGDSQVAQVSFLKDAPAEIVVTSPRWGDVAHPTLHLDATCTDDDPGGCAELNATIRSWGGGEIYVTASSPDRLLADIDISPLSAAEMPLDVTFAAGIGAYIEGIFAEDSPNLSAVAEGPGPILDFDDARLLCVDAEGHIVIVDRATHASTSVMYVERPVDAYVVPYGYLTSSGAVIYARSIFDFWSGRMALYAWRDGVLSTLADDFNVGKPVGVVDDYMLWTHYDAYLLTNLATGDTVRLEDIVSTPDLLEGGAVVYRGEGGVYRYQAGVTTLLSSSGRYSPVTDGINIAYTTCHEPSCSTLLSTPAGEVPLGTYVKKQPYELHAPESYQLRAGYTAFARTVSGTHEVWVRTPGGEEHQVSVDGASSRIDESNWRRGHDLISDTGEVIFTHENRRYLGAPGVLPRDIGAVYDQGILHAHARWFNGAWYTVLGDTLFAVTGGSSGAGGGEGGGGEGGAGTTAGVGGAGGADATSGAAGAGGADATVGAGGADATVGAGGADATTGAGGADATTGAGGGDTTAGSGGADTTAGAGGAGGTGGEETTAGSGGADTTAGAGGAGGTAGADTTAGSGGTDAASSSSAMSGGGSATSAATASAGSAGGDSTAGAGGSGGGPSLPGCGIGASAPTRGSSAAGLSLTLLAAALTARTRRRAASGRPGRTT